MNCLELRLEVTSSINKKNVCREMSDKVAGSTQHIHLNNPQVTFAKLSQHIEERLAPKQ